MIKNILKIRIVQLSMVVLSLGLLMTSCSSEDKGTTKRTFKSKTTGDVTVDNKSKSKDLGNGFNLGLPNYCTASFIEPTRLCLECTPRSIPIYHCRSLTSDYNPEESCFFSKAEVRCKTKETKDWVVSLEHDDFEVLYQRLPHIAVAVQMLIDKTLFDAKGRKVANDALKFANDFAGEIIVRRNVGAPADNIVKIIKEHYPETDAKELEQIHNNAKLIGEGMIKMRQRGELTIKTLSIYSMALLDLIPVKLSTYFPDLNAEQVEAFLNAVITVEDVSTIFEVLKTNPYYQEGLAKEKKAAEEEKARAAAAAKLTTTGEGSGSEVKP